MRRGAASSIRGLAAAARARYAARCSRRIEINGSFYSLQRPRARRAGTSRRRTTSCSRSRAGASSPTCCGCADVETRARELLRLRAVRPAREARADPLAVPAEPALRRGALRSVPRDAAARRPTQAALARRHDARMKGAAGLTIDANRAAAARRGDPPRELRDAGFIELLRQHESRWSSPTPPASGRCCDDVTADFIYVRLHGDEELYVSGYSDARASTTGRAASAAARRTQAATCTATSTTT